ncbi:ABC transporter permease [Nonomuraea ferruginea]
MLAGAIGGLIHAIATVTFGVDHIISGVAINLLGPGVTRFLSEVLYKEGSPANQAGAGITTSPAMSSAAPELSLPLLSDGPDWLGSLESTRWFLVGDVAGILRGLTHNVNVLVILAVLMLPLTFFVLWHTSFGLRLRSAGENPWAAESLGVNVYRIKYIAVVISGAFAGLGGVFLVFVSTKYVEGQTAGRGFIGLAAMIFGNWRPGGLAAGAALFGYADGLQLRSQGGDHVLPAPGRDPAADLPRRQGPPGGRAVGADRQGLHGDGRRRGGRGRALLALADRRPAAERVRLHHAARAHAAGAPRRVAAAADAQGRRRTLPTGEQH